MYYFIVTYGCQMNLHESEKVGGVLEAMGYSPVDVLEAADIVVFNTCCIRSTAESRALGNIGKLKAWKLKNKNALLVVLGCMTQQSGSAEKIKKSYPFIDIILGTNNLHLLPECIACKKSEGKKFNCISVGADATYDLSHELDKTRTSYPNAWVNIIYGCDNFCSYCIVPYVRGREVSRSSDEILREVGKLLDDGYKEITLLGQNVNSYKWDSVDFAALLERIASTYEDKKFRLSFMTSHPKDFDDRLIGVIQKYANISRHIHLPTQSGNNEILKKMNRKYTREHYIELVKAIKSKIKNALVTTDLMVGFPTETEENFLDTLSLIGECEFSQAFTFIYSPRNGTAAAKLPDVDKEVKKSRIMQLVKAQNKMTKKISDSLVDTTQEVLIEGVDKSGKYVGRTHNGRLVAFERHDEYKIGDFVLAKILSSKSASLQGRIIRVSEQ